MRVIFNVVGMVEHFDNVTVDLDAIPREGDTVELPGLPAEHTTVRTVVWYPLGDADDEDNDGTPFVYIVLGARRWER